MSNSGIIGPKQAAGVGISSTQEVCNHVEAGNWPALTLGAPSSVEYIVVAGGGAGGSERGGGGGAGGYRSSVSGESSGGGAAAESAHSVTDGNTYTVTIGAGGA